MASGFSSCGGTRIDTAGFSKSEIILLTLSGNDWVFYLVLRKSYDDIASVATANLGWDVLVYCRRGQLLRACSGQGALIPRINFAAS